MIVKLDNNALENRPCNPVILHLLGQAADEEKEGQCHGEGCD